MYAHIGNTKPIESFLDPATGEVKWRRLGDEAVTSFEFPPDTTVDDAVLIVLDALPHHMGRDATPAWIETDDKNLTRRLCVQFDIPLTKNKRPAAWGGQEESRRAVTPKKRVAEKKAAAPPAEPEPQDEPTEAEPDTQQEDES